MNSEDNHYKVSLNGVSSNPSIASKPFQIFKPIPHKKWERHFQAATDHDTIALKFVDTHERNIANIEPLISSLEGPLEIYVLLWTQAFGCKSKATVWIPSLRAFKAGRDITFRESNRQYERQSSFFRSCWIIDEGYRSLVVLVPKTAQNLRVLKAWADKRRAEIPEYYRKDFAALKSA